MGTIDERPATSRGAVAAGTPILAGTRAAGRYAIGVGAHNALTARLGEIAGFDLLWLSGLEISSSKALPDVNLITPTEVGTILREVRSATSLPIVVDADNGYGSDETAARAVADFAAAGANAVCIEDNAFPKRNSFYESDRTLEPADAFCERIMAARQAAGEALEVIARTEGLVAGMGVQHTIERVHRYVEAGCDAVFVQTKLATVDQYKELLPQVRDLAPIVCTPTMLPETSASELHELGVDIVIYANVAVRATVRAVEAVFARLSEAEQLEAVESDVATLTHLFELTASAELTGPAVSRLHKTSM